MFNEQGVVCGASLQHFLLEKSRVVQLATGERRSLFRSSDTDVAQEAHTHRSFHVFYQLVRGASVEERKRWGLLASVEQYRLLCAADTPTTIAGVDDAALFRQLKASMSVLGFEQREIELIFGTLAFVLNVGNIGFAGAAGGAAELAASATLSAVRQNRVSFFLFVSLRANVVSGE